MFLSLSLGTELHPQPFCIVRQFCWLPRLGLNLQSSFVSLLECWDYRCVPPSLAEPMSFWLQFLCSWSGNLNWGIFFLLINCVTVCISTVFGINFTISYLTKGQKRQCFASLHVFLTKTPLLAQMMSPCRSCPFILQYLPTWYWKKLNNMESFGFLITK